MAKKEYYEFDPETKKIAPLKNSWAKMDKWKVFKQVVGMAASGCASIVISKYLKSNMPESSNIFEKAVMGVGMYFITGVVGSNIAKYAEQELDEWRDSVMMIKEASDDGKPE